jgi:DNA-binding MarR family transcriptional regulator
METGTQLRVVDAGRLERRRVRAVKSRAGEDRRPYFYAVAEARYLLRKVFRLIEDQARRAGLDPLAHQALVQIYGSTANVLKVREVAERLDITPAFASTLIQDLAAKGLVSRSRDRDDQRVMWISVTQKGLSVLYRIDEKVQAAVDRFTRGLSDSRTEAAISILMFYAGVSLRRSVDPFAAGSTGRPARSPA